jgi:enoyl-[acyl-carrier protein] reductase II
MFEGDLIEGELEIGQISACIDRIEPVHLIMQRLMAEYTRCHERLLSAITFNFS